jgi:putative transposase
MYLLIAFIKFQSRLVKSMQQILRLLPLNLFEKRDLMALLRGDPVKAGLPNVNQIALL